MKNILLLLSGLVVFSVSLSACSEETSPILSPAREISPAVEAPVHYLPYGKRAPNPLPPNTVPEPYDPVKHGPPMPNSIAHLNLANLPGQRTELPGLGRRVTETPTSVQPLGGFSKGLRWTSSTYKDIYGEHEIELGLNLPLTTANNVVFAPTVIPSGSA